MKHVLTVAFIWLLIGLAIVVESSPTNWDGRIHGTKPSIHPPTPPTPPPNAPPCKKNHVCYWNVAIGKTVEERKAS
ncbi:hypothetical protein HDU96_004498, partial [Phlyctochytrium bullatum]